MPMPTDEQLREYVGQLPPIYRDILAAYPELNPARKAGQGLAVVSFVDLFGVGEDDFGNEFRDERYDEDEVVDAFRQLEERRFLSRDPVLGALRYAPTELGERLITLLTGRAPRPKGAPLLPQPAWA